MIISGHPRPGTPEGLYLCCVFGRDGGARGSRSRRGVLRCRAPPHPPGRVPFYISCLGGGKRPASDIGTFEFRDATSRHPSAKDRRAAEVRLATGVTERDFQMRLVHLLIGSGQGGAGPRQGGGGGGTPPGEGARRRSGAEAEEAEGGEGGGVGPASSSGGGGPGSEPGPSANDSASGGGGSGGSGSGGGAPRERRRRRRRRTRRDDDGRGLRLGRSRPPKLHPGAAFARKAVAALGLNPSDLDALSDGDVAKTFKTALEARLRHAISAEAKALRARREKAAAAGVAAAPGVIPDPGFVAPPGSSIYHSTDQRGMGLIHCVAALGMNWAIPAMTKSGCDVNQPDRRHRTALHWAAAKGHEDTVATLLASGANIRAAARWGAGGYTAADLAAALGHGGIAAYISETSLAASLSNISLYGGPRQQGRGGGGIAARPGASLLARTGRRRGRRRLSEALRPNPPNLDPQPRPPGRSRARG